SPDGKILASGGYEKNIRLWDSVTGQQQAILRGHKAAVRTLAFSPDGKLLASGSSDRSIRLWEKAEGAWKERVKLPGQDGAIHALAFAVEGKLLASASEDKTVKLWDIGMARERSTLSGHKDMVLSL